MKHFMEPQSVAIIGISRRSGPGSYNLMENMINYGYPGKIFPINPYAKEILGIKAYANVKKVDQKIDLAIISLPRELVVKAVTECVEAGVKAIIVVTQGFADADEQGKAFQREIVALRTGFHSFLSEVALGDVVVEGFPVVRNASLVNAADFLLHETIAVEFFLPTNHDLPLVVR